MVFVFGMIRLAAAVLAEVLLWNEVLLFNLEDVLLFSQLRFKLEREDWLISPEEFRRVRFEIDGIEELFNLGRGKGSLL